MSVNASANSENYNLAYLRHDILNLQHILHHYIKIGRSDSGSFLTWVVLTVVVLIVGRFGRSPFDILYVTKLSRFH